MTAFHQRRGLGAMSSSLCSSFAREFIERTIVLTFMLGSEAPQHI
uniref:Uncharacterized protein n=1 Tax=Arundo donax TaxID=35708 RepID=A0A0A8YPB0_ARUDO